MKGVLLASTVETRKKKESTKDFAILLSKQSRHAYLVAFDTLCGKLVFITLGAVYVMFFRNKGFGADWVMAGAANEAFLMPLPRLVLHFLHS